MGKVTNQRLTKDKLRNVKFIEKKYRMSETHFR